MSLHRTRRAVMSTLVVVACVGAGLGLTPAHAATTFVCSLNAKTTSLDPIPPVTKVGGSGAYTVAGTATCVTGGKVQHYGVDATGMYYNMVCGTGTAFGLATFTGGTVTPNPTGYAITFAAGQGVLKVITGGTGNGVVDITPANVGGCVTRSATGFTIRALATITQ